MDIDLLVPGRKPVGPVRINTKHTMGRGIKACWLFQDLEGNENVHDLSGHQEVGTVNGATFGRARGGNRVLSVNDALTVTIPNYVRDPIGTCIFKFKHNDRSATQRYMGSHDAFEVGISSGDNKVRHQFWGGGAGYTQASLVMTDQVWYTCISGWDSVTGNTRIAMQGIQEVTSPTNADDDPGTTPVTFTIGNRTGSADADSFDGEFEFIVFKDYVVNRAEMKAWSLNPYQFLEPAYDFYPFYFPTPAPVAIGTPTVAGETHSSVGSGDLVTPTFTIPDGHACYVFCFVENNNIGAFTEGFSSLTFTERDTDAASRMKVFSAIGDATSASTGATCQIGRGGPASIVAITIENAEDIPINSADFAWAGGANESITLPVATAATSIMVSWLGAQTNGTVTADSPAVLLTNTGSASHGLCLSWEAGGDDTIAHTHAGTTKVIVAFEIQELGLGGGARRRFMVTG